MPITPHQKRQRRAHIGSSDAPIIVGIDPYNRGIESVYWSKIAEQPDDGPTEAQASGLRLENVIIDYAAERLGVDVFKNQFRVAKVGDGVPAASHDALVVGKPEGIEAKYVSAANKDQWGEDGTDQASEATIIQCQHQMMVSDLECVWVPVLVASFQVEWRIYRVPRNEAIINLLLDKEVEFWHQHVLPKIPPTDAPPPMELLRAVRREPNSIVELDDDMPIVIEAWEQAKRDKKAADEAEDEAKRRLISALGEAEAGRLEDGRMLTYLSQRAAPKFDGKRLKLEMPDVWAKYAEESTCRVLRLKKAKEA